MKKLFRKISYIIAAVFCSAVSFVDSALIPVSANSSAIRDYTTTDILDDLSDIPVALYPKDAEGVPEVIRFQEYCYSEKVFFDEYYGLFLYIYNPTEKAIQTDGNNVVNMAMEYDVNGEPTDWENVKLVYCDKTENNRFYKFELLSDQTDLLSMARTYAAAHGGDRRYDLVGIQLTHMTEMDHTYAKTYTFSGLAAGCGASTESESTLSCTVEGLKTIELDVYHTNYRTGDYVDYVCDELNTAYFAVPNEYFENYGGLQKIKAEWYEYKTKLMFVTSDSPVYSALHSYIGEDIGEKDGVLDYRVLWEETSKSVSGTTAIEYTWNNRYNAVDGETAGSPWSEDYSDQYTSRIDWLFEREGVTEVEEYKVSANEVEDYMTWYTNVYGGERLNGYSAELFADSIDSDRLELLEYADEGATRGYVVEEIDAEEDEQNLLVEKNQSWWDRAWKGVKYEEKSLDPIIILGENIKDLTVSEFAETYLVNPNEAEMVYSNCLAMLASGKKPVLFRFAVTDYYASTARFDSLDNRLLSDQDGYVAQMTEFLDFDIISLTFRNEKKKDTVLGVVADPVDVINGVDPAPDLSVGSPSILEGFIGFFMNGLNPFDRMLRSFLGIVFVGVLVIVVISFMDKFIPKKTKVVVEDKNKSKSKKKKR